MAIPNGCFTISHVSPIHVLHVFLVVCMCVLHCIVCLFGFNMLCSIVTLMLIIAILLLQRTPNELVQYVYCMLKIKNGLSYAMLPNCVCGSPVATPPYTV